MEFFLKELTIDSIDRVIACFKDGIDSRAVLPKDFDPRRAQLACHRIHRLTMKGSTAMNSMYEIPKFWINLDGLIHSSNLNVMESCFTRVFCMQGSMSFHRWLSNVVPTAVNHRSRNTWLDKLAWDVRLAIERNKRATFASTDYLPNLSFHHVYTLVPPSRFLFDQRELILSVVSSIVRLWLHFPSDEFSFIQLSLIDIITSKSPSSILFLGEIWNMYKSPFATVFNKWDKRSKTKIKTALADFEEEFAHHPFAIAGSLEYRKLEFLSQLITQWSEKNDIDLDSTNMASNLLLVLFFFFSHPYLTLLM
jgi:hypothetical protein